MVLFISQLAREHGIKVLLSGAGGDDIFSGYRRHYALSQEGKWKWLPRILRKKLKSLAARIPITNLYGRRLAKAFQYADYDADERIVSYFFLLDPKIQQILYSPELRQALAGVAPSEPLVMSLNNIPANIHALNKMLYLEGKHFLTDHNLNYTDKMSMAVGVEVRVPLLDPELVRFAAVLPPRLKQHGGEGKWIFKKAMEPFLPHEVIYRRKTGFGVPLRYWLRHKLRPVVEDVLSKSSLTNRGLFDPTGVHQLVKMDRDGRIDASYPIFELMCIELWCRIFIDGKTSM